MEYKFNLQLGDWSRDGHCCHENFLIKSNKTVEHVRELYFKACEALGWRLDDTNLLEFDTLAFPEDKFQQLLDLGITLLPETLSAMQENDFGQDEFVELLLATIRTQDPELKIKVDDEFIPEFHFYGPDEEGRQIRSFAYFLLSP